MVLEWGQVWVLEWGLVWGLELVLEWGLEWGLEWVLEWDLEWGLELAVLSTVGLRGGPTPLPHCCLPLFLELRQHLKPLS